MNMTKKTAAQEIGRRTRLKNHDVQLMLETLFEVWTEEFIADVRIELENFRVLEIHAIDRGEECGTIANREVPRTIRRVPWRVSKQVRRLMN